jgi:hypothetical protein
MGIDKFFNKLFAIFCLDFSEEKFWPLLEILCKFLFKLDLTFSQHAVCHDFSIVSCMPTNIPSLILASLSLRNLYQVGETHCHFNQ